MFSPPEETIPRNKRKMKVVHQKNHKNKAIILKYIIFQQSKFSAQFYPKKSVEAEQYQKNVFERSEYTKPTNHGVVVS